MYVSVNQLFPFNLFKFVFVNISELIYFGRKLIESAAVICFYFFPEKKLICIFKNYSVQEQNELEVYIRNQIQNEKDKETENIFCTRKKKGKNIWSKIKYFREENEIFLKLCQ